MTYAQIFSLPLWIFGGVMLFYGLVATFSPSVRGYDFFGNYILDSLNGNT